VYHSIVLQFNDAVSTADDRVQINIRRETVSAGLKETVATELNGFLSMRNRSTSEFMIPSLYIFVLLSN
jgi:hypothetical protein